MRAPSPQRNSPPPPCATVARSTPCSVASGARCRGRDPEGRHALPSQAETQMTIQNAYPPHLSRPAALLQPQAPTPPRRHGTCPSLATPPPATHRHNRSSVWSWSGDRRRSSWRQPREVLGHFDPGFSGGRHGTAASTLRFNRTRDSGNPLQPRPCTAAARFTRVHHSSRTRHACADLHATPFPCRAHVHRTHGWHSTHCKQHTHPPPPNPPLHISHHRWPPICLLVFRPTPPHATHSYTRVRTPCQDTKNAVGVSTPGSASRRTLTRGDKASMSPSI